MTGHAWLWGVAQSRRQRVPASESTADRCACIQGADPVGQGGRTRTRDACHGLHTRTAPREAHERSCRQSLEGGMPAVCTDPSWSPSSVPWHVVLLLMTRVTGRQGARRWQSSLRG